VALPRTPDEILLLHHPRCSKSRATKALLEDRGLSFTTRLYLEEPLSSEELADLGDRLGKPIREWTRTKEKAFAEAGLTRDSTEEALRAALVEAPILMERPIVIRGRRAAIGRPPENVASLLED